MGAMKSAWGNHNSTPSIVETREGKDPGMTVNRAFNTPITANNGPYHTKRNRSSREKDAAAAAAPDPSEAAPARSLSRAALIEFPVVCHHTKAQHKAWTEYAFIVPIASTSFAYSFAVSTSLFPPPPPPLVVARAKQKAFA